MTVTTSPDQIRRLVHELYDAWSLHQPERIDAIFTDDAIYEDVAGGQIVRGKEAIKQLRRRPPRKRQQLSTARSFDSHIS